MAKLTDEQLMILDNLIYLREIALDSRNRNFKTVGEFISYITIDGKTVDFDKIANIEQQAKVDTLMAAGQYDAAESVRNMSLSDFSEEYINDEVRRSYQKTVDMVKLQGSPLMNLKIEYTSERYAAEFVSCIFFLKRGRNMVKKQGNGLSYFLIVMKFHGIPITKKQPESLTVLDEGDLTGEIEIKQSAKALRQHRTKNDFNLCTVLP